MFFEFALIGTTASGKTSLANALAREFKAVILSLDSLCVYKEINIANAKTHEQTLKELDYFGVNLLSVCEHFNVNLFIKEYEKARQFAKTKDLPLIITGGTSFYLKAMMDGLSAKIEERQSPLGNDEIYTLLKQIDPEFKSEKNDTYRLRKWLSIYENTGELPSVFLKRTQKKPVIENLLIYEITWDKKLLRENIAKRTKTMLQHGLIEEAKYLFRNFNPSLKPLNSIGLKECKSFLDQKISLSDLENLINTHTAQLAKRQRTFNKKFQSIPLEFDKAFNILKQKFESFP